MARPRAKEKRPGAKFALYRNAYDASGTDAANAANAENLVLSGLTATLKGEAPNQVAQICANRTYPSGTCINGAHIDEDHVSKLDPGIYYLVETEAPAGYNLSAPVKLEVKVTSQATAEGTTDTVTTTAAVDGKPLGPDKLVAPGSQQAQPGASASQPGTQQQASDSWILKVPNSAGYELPHTGGPGTAPFAAAGALLALAAAGILLRTRRPN